jgi:O-antigen ligase
MIQNKYKYLTILTIASIFISTFFLPLKTSISNIGLIGLVITTLLSFGFNGFQKKGKLVFFLLFSPMVFFLPLLWGWIYSPIQSDAFNELSKYIFLGLTPLFLFRKDISTHQFRTYASIGLLAGSVLSGLILLIINFYNFSQSTYPPHWLLNHTFTSFNFLKPLSDMHPIYMGMYFAMALSILFFTQIKLPKFLKVLAFVIFSLSIVFLASRIIYGVLALLVLLYLIYNLTFKSFVVILTGILVLGVLSFNTLQKTYLYHKTVKGTLWELQENVGTYNTNQSMKVDSRWSRWQAAIDLIKEQSILGYGGGTENEVLLEEYKLRNMKNSVEREYNAHNQYLGFFLRFGVIGFMLLLLYFFRNTVIAFKYHNLLFLSFLIILFWSFMVENILDRNMGINFVALFGTLFYAEFYVKESKDLIDETTS